MAMRVEGQSLTLRWRNGQHRQAKVSEGEIIEWLESRHTTTPQINVLAAEWWEAVGKNKAPNTRKLYEWLIGSLIAPHLGDTTAGELTPAMVEDWIGGLTTGAVAKGKAQTLLGQILRRGVKDNRIPPEVLSAFELADRPKQQRAERPFVPSPQQVEALCDMSSRRDALFIRLMAYCGLAPIDALTLTWQEPEKDERGGTFKDGELRGRRMKTGEPFRFPVARVLPTFAAMLSAERGIGPIVSPAISYPNWRKRVWYEQLGAEFNPYSLRHSFVSLMLRDPDVSRAEVAEWAGHSLKSQERYSHVMESGPQKADEAIRAAFQVSQHGTEAAHG